MGAEITGTKSRSYFSERTISSKSVDKNQHCNGLLTHYFSSRMTVGRDPQDGDMAQKIKEAQGFR